MIELHTNPDDLITLSDATPTPHDGIPAKTIRMAAHDIKNLRDHAEGLERYTAQMSAEIASIRTQRDNAAAALLAIFKPELDKMIDDSIDDCRTFSDIMDRLDKLEDTGNESDTIRDEVRNMIRDGDITVNIDHM